MPYLYYLQFNFDSSPPALDRPAAGAYPLYAVKSIKTYIPHIVVFISAMGIMIIGIVLAGISLGNFLGGRLADRYPAKKAAPVLLEAAKK